MRVLFRRTVECRSNDFTLNCAAHVGYFFWTLVNQQHDQLHFGMIALDAGCNRLHHRRLTCLRWRNDDAALALSDWRDEVDDSSCHVVWIGRIF